MSEYRSTVLIPADAASEFEQRASRLGIGRVPLVRSILITAMERRELPSSYSPPPPGGMRVQFPFSLDGQLVRDLGGQKRARELVVWAIVEGLGESPFAY